MKRKNSTVMDGLDYIDPDIRLLARPIGDLNPDPANARKHPDRNLEAIKSSLARFGQKKPLVARPVNGSLIVVAGNGTLAAAKALGWTHMAVSVKEMSDVEATAYGIADNKTAELAEWDYDVLAGLLGSLDADLQVVTGFDEAEIAGLLGDKVGTPESVGEIGEALKYGVVIEELDEQQQSNLLTRLEAEGLKCRALTL